ncbi:MAG TPA: hypothetical protein VFS58_16370 [Steroidobacteraceae bacterium]|nr:hypothetical protein [Steroidobacteraceae bacterium]
MMTARLTLSDDQPLDLERHKLDRLRELRAAIDTLRCGKESQDPLLAWIPEREGTENRHHD